MTAELFPCAMFLFMLWTLQPLNHTEKNSFDLAKCWQKIKWKDKIKTEKGSDTGKGYEWSWLLSGNKSCYQVTFLRDPSAVETEWLKTSLSVSCKDSLIIHWRMILNSEPIGMAKYQSETQNPLIKLRFKTLSMIINFWVLFTGFVLNKLLLLLNLQIYNLVYIPFQTTVFSLLQLYTSAFFIYIKQLANV